MKDKCTYTTDGVSVYLDLTLVSSLTGRIILVILNLILWTGFILIFSFIPKEEISSFIFPAILIIAFLIYVPLRFTLWNIWGKEFIRVSPRSISHSRSYGFFSTKEKTIDINRFGFGYEVTKKFGGEDYGTFYFYNYQDNDNPELIFENSIHISKETAEEITELLDSLIKKEDLRYQIEEISIN